MMENELIYTKQTNLIRHILLTMKIMNILYFLYPTNLNDIPKSLSFKRTTEVIF